MAKAERASWRQQVVKVARVSALSLHFPDNHLPRAGLPFFLPEEESVPPREHRVLVSGWERRLLHSPLGA